LSRSFLFIQDFEEALDPLDQQIRVNPLVLYGSCITV